MFPFFAAINFGSGKRQGRPHSKTLPRRLAKCLFFNREWTRSNANKAEYSFKERVIAFAVVKKRPR